MSNWALHLPQYAGHGACFQPMEAMLLLVVGFWVGVEREKRA
jgi:hypothetical protein